jgi:LTXXQ motif family protein
MKHGRFSAAAVGATVATFMLVSGSASAQRPTGPENWGWGSGMMMGPGMMRGGFDFMCNPRVAGLAEWRIKRIESAVNPNEPQRAALNELRMASTKAAELIAGTCPADVPAKSTERLQLMEKRLDAMLQAIKVVRPAFEAFYNSLDDAQKTHLDAIGPRQWGWRGWHWRWPGQ